ncbi:hypothetical protein [Erythrobacter sp. A6_0]|jgi:hypothetical protein|uniref:hypothetical protein n=1 Tax=Erythrobacter sp. A6_0 TaxID=2821089 RepID=UPI001ADB7970|nr:hypothetical protein [Erythrobacter sp. A6_0]MBO9509999.1 hypothetical protein [Erythrobacter sp. A6_0]|tara:strand:+ start:46 stop:459 length:414 start_codon:yes stop_codon:yes gene_type:complete
MVKHVSTYGARAVAKARTKTPGRTDGMPGPTDNPATNLMMADVVIRAGSYVARRAIEKGILRGRYGKDVAKNIVQNKTLGQSLVSFGLAKLATKNLPGAMIVGGGALVKTLYDRRKSRGGQRREGDRELIEQARGED